MTRQDAPWGIAAATLAIVPAALASMYVATWLFPLNAPQFNALVKDGWGFDLYFSLAAGGLVGALAAFGVAVRSRRFCTVVGALAGVGLLLWALSGHLSPYGDAWEGADLLALPICMSFFLLLWGLFLRRAG